VLRKFAFSLFLASSVALALAVPAAAFDGRAGQDVIVPAGQTVNDDLYLAGSTITVDGTVNGDVFAVGQTIMINGVVNGNLFAASQTVMVNGKVIDSVRIGGAALLLGDQAAVGRDVLALGGSYESRPGASVGRDALFLGGQARLAGVMARNVLFAGGGLELAGRVGGNVKAEVGEVGSGSPSPAMYGQPEISIPTVPTGLTIDPGSSIGGNLDYTQSKDLPIPSGVVAGQITRVPPSAARTAPQPMSGVQRAANWFLNLIRTYVTLLLIGLLLAWLAPRFVKALAESLRARPMPSLGWGIMAYLLFFLALFVLILALVLAGVLFGVLTLGGLSAAAVLSGLVGAAVLVLGFVLVTSWLTKVTVSELIGKLLLNAARPGLGEHRVWPLFVGVAIISVLVSLPFVGWLFGIATVLFGLGSLWIWGREAIRVRA